MIIKIVTRLIDDFMIGHSGLDRESGIAGGFLITRSEPESRSGWL